MNLRTAICVVSIFSCMATAAQTQDVTDPEFLPLSIGTEWVYLDSSWTSFRMMGSALTPGYMVFERTVRITDSLSIGDTSCRIIAVHLKGRMQESDTAATFTAIDSQFIDTLRFPASGSFLSASFAGIRYCSRGTIGLFPWLQFDPASTAPAVLGSATTEISRVNDSLLYAGTASSYSGGTVVADGSEAFVAARSIGMIRGVIDSRSTMNGVSGRIIVLRKFNGTTIDAATYVTIATAVRTPYYSGRMAQQHLQPAIKTMINLGYSGAAGIDLKGRTLPTPRHLPAGLYIVNHRTIVR